MWTVVRLYNIHISNSESSGRRHTALVNIGFSHQTNPPGPTLVRYLGRRTEHAITSSIFSNRLSNWALLLQSHMDKTGYAFVKLIYIIKCFNIVNPLRGRFCVLPSPPGFPTIHDSVSRDLDQLVPGQNRFFGFSPSSPISKKIHAYHLSIKKNTNYPTQFIRTDLPVLAPL